MEVVFLGPDCYCSIIYSCFLRGYVWILGFSRNMCILFDPELIYEPHNYTPLTNTIDLTCFIFSAKTLICVQVFSVLVGCNGCFFAGAGGRHPGLLCFVFVICWILLLLVSNYCLIRPLYWLTLKLQIVYKILLFLCKAPQLLFISGTWSMFWSAC